MTPLSRLLLPLLCLVGPNLYALESDRQQPIAIEADRLTIDDKRGVSIYQGSVRLTQGSLEVTAERITVKKPGNQVESVDSRGTPVHFRQQGDIPAENLRGFAERIHYNLKSSSITLTGDAHLWQNQDEFSGEEIHYNLTTRRVKARGGNNGNRVRVILQPRQEGEK